jgi:hypothetical protein
MELYFIYQERRNHLCMPCTKAPLWDKIFFLAEILSRGLTLGKDWDIIG